MWCAIAVKTILWQSIPKSKSWGEKSEWWRKITKPFEKISHCFRSRSTEPSSTLLSNITFRRVCLCQSQTDTYTCIHSNTAQPRERLSKGEISFFFGKGDWERARVAKCIDIYTLHIFWYATRNSVSRCFMSVLMVSMILVALLSHFIFFCVSIFACCIHFGMGIDFVTCIDTNGSVCVWIFNNDTTAQFSMARWTKCNGWQKKQQQRKHTEQSIAQRKSEEHRNCVYVIRYK